MNKSPGAFFGLLFLVLLAARLCHLEILWAEEDLPLAAAVQMLEGKVLYRDVWFDKPPLTAAICALWGAQTGWILRLAGALWVLAACALLYELARRMWSPREGRLAACGLGFFLTFGIPAAVIPLAADSLMLVPHVAAVYLAWRGRSFWSGVTAGVAFLFNAKALFVLAACGLWLPRSLPGLAGGFAVPNLIALAWLGVQGALHDYYLQVWKLGALYAGNTFLDHPIRNGLVRTVNWMGFHAALVAGAGWFWWRDRESGRRRLALWAVLSLVAVTAGWRFFPRYYFQLLPVMALAAARGFVLLGRRGRIVVLVALVVPFVRFGPRYAMLARDLASGREHDWRDVAMNRDSREAARLILERATRGDTLFVWGFRPDIFAYTRMPAGTRFLECQPLTGVFADRHLVQSAGLAPEWTKASRAEVIRSHPTFVADGLSLYNPELSMERYPELRRWLEQYEEVVRTRFTVIYKRKRAEKSYQTVPIPNSDSLESAGGANVTKSQTARGCCRYAVRG